MSRTISTSWSSENWINGQHVPQMLICGWASLLRCSMKSTSYIISKVPKLFSDKHMFFRHSNTNLNRYNLCHPRASSVPLKQEVSLYQSWKGHWTEIDTFPNRLCIEAKVKKEVRWANGLHYLSSWNREIRTLSSEGGGKNILQRKENGTITVNVYKTNIFRRWMLSFCPHPSAAGKSLWLHFSQKCLRIQSGEERVSNCPVPFKCML